MTAGVDRWGLSKAFVDAGYETVFGDLMFGLDIPIAIHTAQPTQDSCCTADADCRTFALSVDLSHSAKSRKSARPNGENIMHGQLSLPATVITSNALCLMI